MDDDKLTKAEQAARHTATWRRGDRIGLAVAAVIFIAAVAYILLR